MADLALSLVVIRSANLERAVQFYRALGLSFIREQHGSGPEHYASVIGSAVFEIYPRDSESRSSAAVRLGFRVPSLGESLAALARQEVELVSAPRDTPWGRCAVVKDPDGHRVEIRE
jgi:catechol 2,3-dioxygenase-like lactoylglutathione lyase family enzyme